jgi:hypothetical protein
MNHVCTRSLFVQYNYIMLSPESTQCLLVPTRLPLSSPILTGGGGGGRIGPAGRFSQRVDFVVDQVGSLGAMLRLG